MDAKNDTRRPEAGRRGAGRPDAARCAMAPVCGGVEMLQARYVRQSFARHFHEEYALGVIEAGAMAFRYRGENVVADAGSVNLVVPGEAHDGHAATGQGWCYRMFYLKPEFVRDVAAQMAGRPVDLPHFRPGVLHDPALAAQVARTHRLLDAPHAPLLHKESALYALVAQWIARHADARYEDTRYGDTRYGDARHAKGHPADAVRSGAGAPGAVHEPACQAACGARGGEPRAVAQARACIHARYGENLSLADLAGVAGLSPFHFLRVFTRSLGLSPHDYLTQTRVYAARALLKGPDRLADVAARVGFADQSHLTRQFKRLVGVTPGDCRRMMGRPLASG
ncbi:MAG: AraC family ligand binding domain-containing protein [Desulfovibrionaceae bacterium]